MSFSKFYQERRSKIDTQAAYCRVNGFTTSYVCALERGGKPPRSAELLRKHAEALGIEEGSEDWYMMHDLSAIEHGLIPAYMEPLSHEMKLHALDQMRESVGLNPE